MARGERGEADGGLPPPRCRARRARWWRARRRSRGRGEAPTSALGRSDSSARRPLSAEITLRQNLRGPRHHSAAAEAEHPPRCPRRPQPSSPPSRAHRRARRGAIASTPRSRARSRRRRHRRRPFARTTRFPPFPAVGWAPTSPRTRARGRTGSPTTKSRSSTPRWRPRRRRGSTSSTSPRTPSRSPRSRLDSTD